MLSWIITLSHNTVETKNKNKKNKGKPLNEWLQSWPKVIASTQWKPIPIKVQSSKLEPVCVYPERVGWAVEGVSRPGQLSSLTFWIMHHGFRGEIFWNPFVAFIFYFLFFCTHTMQRAAGRVCRIITSSVASVLPRASSTQSSGIFTVQPKLQKLQQQGIPGGFLKWGSLSFCRPLSFASGFTPLQPKPLGSILDIERVKDRSSEDIASIWDDVMIFPCPFLSFFLWNSGGYVIFRNGFLFFSFLLFCWWFFFWPKLHFMNLLDNLWKRMTWLQYAWHFKIEIHHPEMELLGK